MLKHAVKQGHECTVVIDQGKGHKRLGIEPYVLDGVRVSEDKRTLKGIDILLTHLDRTAEAEEMCAKRGIPLAQVFHNDQRPAMTKHCDLAIYNSRWVLKHAPMPFDCPSVVLHPPIFADDYRVKPTGDYITLVNLQRPKGVDMFYALAQLMPEYNFLGVKGSYGTQIDPPRGLKNVTIVENQRDIRKVYAETRILLMPSSYESYGRCAVEAAVSGIPTIAHPTLGLREALGDAGTYPVPDSDSWACAVRYVLDTYGTRSALARALGKSLTPEADMDRCLAAMKEIL
jgi:glycosyltransferase involved in cell wall biosynthesis